jgi:segregation and condensation protein B
MESAKLGTTIEAILFVAGEPISIKKFAEILQVSDSTIESALAELETSLEKRGLRLLQKDELVSLVTAPEFATQIEQFIKEEVMGKLSKAALETITVIAYKHPVSRPEIDYIRGVNSGFTLRNLITRGLVERVHPSTSSGQGNLAYLYQPTMEFMKHLGISSLDELPDYAAFRQELEKGLQTQERQL